MVQDAGNYEFIDCVKVGIPLIILLEGAGASLIYCFNAGMLREKATPMQSMSAAFSRNTSASS